MLGSLKNLAISAIENSRASKSSVSARENWVWTNLWPSSSKAKLPARGPAVFIGSQEWSRVVRRSDGHNW